MDYFSSTDLCLSFEDIKPQPPKPWTSHKSRSREKKVKERVEFKKTCMDKSKTKHKTNDRTRAKTSNKDKESVLAKGKTLEQAKVMARNLESKEFKGRALE
ncbi:uncharacterized protein [Pleurodeles waltl]|uniref:uncharacterized protein n=1 Tax=Pleurodeles waltl TaxID=8319 RepID=UPI0037093E29